jgi:hypothetical protein
MSKINKGAYIEAIPLWVGSVHHSDPEYAKVGQETHSWIDVFQWFDREFAIQAGDCAPKLPMMMLWNRLMCRREWAHPKQVDENMKRMEVVISTFVE